MISKTIYNIQLLIEILIIGFKYKLYYNLLSSKNFLTLLKRIQEKKSLNSIQENDINKNILLFKTNRIISLVFPSISCLIRSIINSEVLYNRGYYEKICFGIIRTENQHIVHAWNESFKNVKYNIIKII